MADEQSNREIRRDIWRTAGKPITTPELEQAAQKMAVAMSCAGPFLARPWAARLARIGLCALIGQGYEILDLKPNG